MLIKAFCSGKELQKQIYEAKQKKSAACFDIWWLGQSGFLIQWNGVCVLFDPYLSDSLTKKYATTNKPHVRMGELVIEPELLDCIDIVTSSHNHTDHLDADTLIPLMRINPGIKFLIPEANRNFVCERLQCNTSYPIGLTDATKVTHHGFTFHGVPAAHNELERDANGNCRYMGYVVTFGKWSIYHSGDTLWYENLTDILTPFKLDVAFLPINGNDPARGVAGNLNAAEAAQLGKAVSAGIVIPHHYHMFEFNSCDPEEFANEANAIDQPFRILKLGAHTSIE